MIYTLSIPFGPLFPLWVLVLGLSLFALIGGFTSIDPKPANENFTDGRALSVSASWEVMIPIGIVAVGLAGVLSWLPGILRTKRP